MSVYLKYMDYVTIEKRKVKNEDVLTAHEVISARLVNWS